MMRETPLPVFTVILLAAGSGRRLGGEAKQFRRLATQQVWQHSFQAFATHPQCRGGVVVCPPSHVKTIQRALTHPPHSPGQHWQAVAGGKQRHASVRAGLEALQAYYTKSKTSPAWVMVHDAARPFISHALLGRLLAGLPASPTPRPQTAIIPALPPSDAVKAIDNGQVRASHNKNAIRHIQTPQLFDFATLYALHQSHAEKSKNSVLDDDAVLYEEAGLPIEVVTGETTAFKITTPSDWEIAEAMAASRFHTQTETRVGFGYDVHRFAPPPKTKQGETKIMLCGVAIPHTRPVVAHSDGDVGLHAATDAVLATIGDGDIGSHFPPSDSRWRGADSAQFLAFACQRLREAGGQLLHLDITIIAEAPKITPHREAMRLRLAEIIAPKNNAVASTANNMMHAKAISVKATTSEGLGFIGAGEGLTCHAVATARLPIDGL
ncbi:MAG: 2-C-methyl-D-erythritol 4-phosphate cytidylyltransferase [Proteobacteria bacterium]|nr:2-C-methyl-D-erythritol 4-phosphate cytidylyltransferase [Pseudomonadota bacterium]